MTLNEAAAIRTRPLRCPKCNRTFRHRGSVAKHLIDHRRVERQYNAGRMTPWRYASETERIVAR